MQGYTMNIRQQSQNQQPQGLGQNMLDQQGQQFQNQQPQGLNQNQQPLGLQNQQPLGLQNQQSQGLNQNRQSQGLNQNQQPQGLQNQQSQGWNQNLQSQQGQNLQSQQGQGFSQQGQGFSQQGQGFSQQGQGFNQSVSRVSLPTQIIEKPVAIHEQIRKEQVEEIQPVVNIEKYKTEIHQVTQPLFDAQTMPVNFQQMTLPTEYLPEIDVMGSGVSQPADRSTVNYQNTITTIVEKPAIRTEVTRTQIIEEIQPVIYKETIVPTVIQETKPVYQKIVEGAVYSHQTLPGKSVAEYQATHQSYGPQRPI